MSPAESNEGLQHLELWCEVRQRQQKIGVTVAPAAGASSQVW